MFDGHERNKTVLTGLHNWVVGIRYGKPHRECAQWLWLFFFPNIQAIINQDTSGLDHPMECDDSSRPSSPSDSSFVSQHALRQAELGRQLQELTKALALKEELANKMVANDSRLTNMRKQYEVSFDWSTENAVGTNRQEARWVDCRENVLRKIKALCFQLERSVMRSGKKGKQRRAIFLNINRFL